MATTRARPAAQASPPETAPPGGPGGPEKIPPPDAPGAPEAPGPAARPGSATPGRRRKKTMVTIRAGPEWRDWVCRLARRERTEVAKLIDRALVELAERTGFRPRCPPR